MSRTAPEVSGWWVEFLASVIRQLPRPGEIEQATAEAWSKSQGDLNEVLKRALLQGAVPDDRFALWSTFLVKVPLDYSHSTQLALFANNHRGEFNYFNEKITNDNFANPTHRLIPGKTYVAKIFLIRKPPISSPDGLAFMKSQGAYLVGAQGLSVVYEQAKEKFPKGKWVISLDEKEACWKDETGAHRVPRVNQRLDGGWVFNLDCFVRGWGYDCCLLCLCD
ncbi:MAG: hypothetical protein WC242_01160 [Candidatus Paceibacterota bacterium]|jgi:hypothetical protein